MSESENKDQNVAKVEHTKRWSPIWIIPLVTLLIGIWIVYHQISIKGPTITLITTNAEGIVANRTAIKSRSVDIGIVEDVELSSDLNQVIITARLEHGLSDLLNKDTVFWVVKPQIGKEGVSGLGTLLSGAYIEVQPGKSKKEQHQFQLLDAPPLASSDAKGVRVILESSSSGLLQIKDPVLFRGFQVGSVENVVFDPNSRMVRYDLFIRSPYEILVTENVRFWIDSGFSVDLDSQGMKLRVGSLSTILSGGVSFDVPNDWPAGDLVKNGSTFTLYDDKSEVTESLYTRHEEFILFFDESIRGLGENAPVEFRGIRIGTVIKAPYFAKDAMFLDSRQVKIPVLIRIEPDRVRGSLGTDSIKERMQYAQIHYGMRASLKTGNLLTGALYIDVDYYDKPDVAVTEGQEAYGYPVLATTSSGMSHMQQKVLTLLDKLNQLPVENVLNEMTNSLHAMGVTLNSLDKILSSKEAQSLPKNVQQSLNDLSIMLKSVQPGSEAYNRLLLSMEHLDNVMRELQPILQTLNQKSNALIFEADKGQDPEPKGAVHDK